MDLSALQQFLDDAFDQALICHGFTDYMRDYEMIIYLPVDSRARIAPVHLRYLFRHCMEAHVNTALRRDIWQGSLDDRLLGDPASHEIDGFCWGVRWQNLYPGATIIQDSARARAWGDALGIDMHEVRFEANAHDITLVFSDLQVATVEPGYALFSSRADEGPTTGNAPA
ncbi:hypothetical protein [Nonomuraea indica]|uniref:YxiG-like protein n=1 Tax=Nonomuraea indica TaxID=1581193 RepID=UPI000C7E71C7|nr:hypothetical protein [Nonomuraea indica]